MKLLDFSVLEVLLDNDPILVVRREKAEKKSKRVKWLYGILQQYLMACGVGFNVLMGVALIMGILFYRW